MRFVRVSALRFGQKGCGRTTVGQAQEQQAGAKVQLHWVRKVEHGVIPKGPREHRHDLARSESASIRRTVGLATFSTPGDRDPA